MKAPCETYRLVIVRNPYLMDYYHTCDECGTRLGPSPLVVIARSPMRGDPLPRRFHLDCYYGWMRWPQAIRRGEIQALARWANAMADLLARLHLPPEHPSLRELERLRRVVARVRERVGAS